MRVHSFEILDRMTFVLRIEAARVDGRSHLFFGSNGWLVGWSVVDASRNSLRGSDRVRVVHHPRGL